MSRQVVRNYRHEMTHIAEVTAVTAAVAFGHHYSKPAVDTRALCGVHIRDGIVMREGTKVKCSSCRYLAAQPLTGRTRPTWPTSATATRPMRSTP